MPPRTADYYWVAISASFAFIALYLGWRGGLPILYAYAAIFASTTLLRGWIVRRRLRDARQAATRGVHGLEGIPIQLDPMSRFSLFALVFALGSVPVTMGPRSGIWFFGLGLLLVVIGGRCLLLLLFGKLPRPTLRFEAAGLWVEQHGLRFLIEWDNVASAEQSELAGPEAVLLKVRDVEALAHTAQEATSGALGAERITAMVARMRELFGFDLVIWASAFGVDGALLRAQIRGYTQKGDRDDLLTLDDLLRAGGAHASAGENWVVSRNSQAEELRRQILSELLDGMAHQDDADALIRRSSERFRVVLDDVEFLMSAIGSYHLRDTVLRGVQKSYDEAHQRVFRSLDAIYDQRATKPKGGDGDRGPLP